MKIQIFLILYALSIPVLMLLDLLWLGYLANDFYSSRISHLAIEVSWIGASFYYLIFILGLTFFGTYPAVVKGTVLTAVVLGGLFGFFTYATYDLANLSTLRNWPISMSVIDILWGTILCALVSGLVVYFYNRFLA
ncbi:DUF2177 family protein [Candidatus Kaiserbacteria bacterium]|nr:DUF2177 family protein [Candidatus Kaiserbacteria bacterium]